MASLLGALRSRRSTSPLSFDDWVNSFNFNGVNYQMPMPTQSLGTNRQEEIEPGFLGHAQMAYRTNGVIFACMQVRALLFSEARFQFRRLSNGRPGDYFGTPDLQSLEIPWPNGTTGDLLMRMIQDADLGGNAYVARRADGQLRRMRPDWTTIVLGSKTGRDLDTEVIGYSYRPYGSHGEKPEILLPDEVAHFAPIPDPLARYRGMSWLTPVVREVMADSAATTHKLKFFENGATSNMVVTLDKAVKKEAFDSWIEAFEDQHRGFLNAYKTIYLGGGADVQVVGSNLQQVEFKATQGAGETRIAAAAGVPPVIVGLSEGLQAATYSNYSQARRRFADGTMRPLWRSVSAALAPLINVPGGAELWYDDRDIPFLREDEKDAAEIQQVESSTVKTLIEAGFEPDSVLQAVAAQDFSKLTHSGRVSVQLYEPGTGPASPSHPTVLPAP